MKKLLIILAAGFICLLPSCSSKKEGGGMSDRAKKNLEACNALNKMFEAGDWSKAGDYIAVDGIDHSGMNGEVKGLDSLKAYFANLGNMMGNFKYELVKEMADDDYVFQWTKQTMTMKVDAMGMTAGSTHTMSGIEVTKFNKDSKATDHWSFTEWADVMKMMPPPPMDTIKTKAIGGKGG